ncbi:MAG: hypothetical protein AB7O62_09025 [Pirellulales bacterium]
MRRISESFQAFVAGGHKPWHVGLAVVAGVLGGFATGWNATVAVLLLLALAANVRTRTLIHGWLLGFSLNWLLTPISYQIGRELLDTAGFGQRLFGAAPSLPVVLFDIDRYTLLGGLALGTAISLPLSWIAAYTARRLHRKLKQIAAMPPFDQPRPWQGMSRLACWLIFGSPARALQAATVPRATGRLRCFSVLTMVAAAGAIYHYQGAELLGSRLLSRIATANEAEAEASSIEFHLAEGRIDIHGLRLADPEHLDRDRLRAAHVTANLDSAALLRGQLHVSKLLLDDLACDISRQEQARPESLKYSGFATLPAHEPQVLASHDSGLALSRYVGGWKGLEASAGRLRNLIARLEEFSTATADLPAGDETLPPIGFFAMRNSRCTPQPAAPVVDIVTLRASGLPGEWNLGTDATLEIANVCSQPELISKATTIVVSAPAHAAEMTVRLDLHKGSRQHKLLARAADFDLAALLQTSAARGVVSVSRGRLSLTCDGRITCERIDLPVKLRAEEIEAQVAADQHPAGVLSQTWNEGLQRVGRLQASGIVEGTWKGLRLSLDTVAAIESWKQALAARGETELVVEIERQLALDAAELAKVAAASQPNVSSSQQKTSPDYEALPQATVQRAETSRGLSDRGLDWRAKGQGRTTIASNHPREEERATVQPARSVVKVRTASSPVGTRTAAVDSEEPSSTEPSEQVRMASDVTAALQYPASVLASDRASERKSAQSIKLAFKPAVARQPSDSQFDDSKPIVIRNTHAAQPQTITMRNLPATEAVDTPATNVVGSAQPTRTMPGGLGLEIGYDGTAKKESDATVQQAAGSKPIGDDAISASRDYVELPTQTATGQNRPSNGQYFDSDENLVTPPDTVSGYEKFKNSVASGFKKIMPDKSGEEEADGRLAGNQQQRQVTRERQSRGIFSPRPTKSGSANDTGDTTPSQAEAGTPWYKRWR